MDHYGIVREIGQGAFGTIYLAEAHPSIWDALLPNRGMSMRLGAEAHSEAEELPLPSSERNWYDNEKEVALKVIPTVCPDNTLAHEFKILSSLSHPHIVRVIELVSKIEFPISPPGENRDVTFVPKTQLSDVLVMEYAPHGDLFEYVVSHHRVTEDIARSFARQIASALEYLHNSGYVHGDIKLENILLFPGNVLKLTDFGFVRRWSSHQKQTSNQGTLHSSAPCLLLKEPFYGPEIDIWAFGVILYQMVVGSEPFSMEDKAFPFKEFKIKSEDKISFHFHGRGSRDFRSLVKRIFREGLLMKHLSWEEIRSSSWLAEVSFCDKAQTPSSTIHSDVISISMAENTPVCKQMIMVSEAV